MLSQALFCKSNLKLILYNLLRPTSPCCGVDLWRAFVGIGVALQRVESISPALTHRIVIAMLGFIGLAVALFVLRARARG
jgi:hypothetical protein